MDHHPAVYTEEVLATTTENYIDEYYNEYISTTTLLYKIYLELYTILSLICVAANILIIFVILKYRRLRKDKVNIIILNWAILNTFFMICQPATLRFSMYYSSSSFTARAFCIVEQSEYTALFGDVLLIMLLFLYWYMQVYATRKCEKFTNHMKFAIGGVYLILIFCFCIHIQSCFNSSFIYWEFGETVLVLSYLAFILFMIVMNITHWIKRRKLIQTNQVSNIPYVLSNVFFMSIVPLIFSIVIQIFLMNRIVGLILISTSLVLAVMNPIYFFIVLYKCNNDFKCFFLKVFKCQCNKYDDELEEEPVVYNGDVHM